MRRLLILCLTLPLWALSSFEKGEAAYEAGRYDEAFEQFQIAAERDRDEEAAYYLGKMYEEGIGTPADPDAAAHWYRRAAQRFHRLVRKQPDYELEKERRRFVEALDLNDTETVEAIEQIVSADFGLKAYRANYVLPVSCGDRDYPSYTASDRYGNCEAEVQLSFRYDIYDDLLGFDEVYTVAYTQHSFWQIYAESKPFRETNHNPEFFVTVMRDDEFGPFSLKSLSLGIAHHSNGQGNIAESGLVDANASTLPELNEHPEWAENRSRSWNYLFASAMMQYGPLFTELRTWWRFPERKGDDDNPRLTDYLGHGSLQFVYPSGQSLTRLELRHNFTTGFGAGELDWTYPVARRSSTYWYVKLFSGYGESLIDYNHYVNKFAVGLSFSR
jgi:phospholipase A1/A2